jgi:hypothetical protein
MSRFGPTPPHAQMLIGFVAGMGSGLRVPGAPACEA